jgi:hypothetical protein
MVLHLFSSQWTKPSCKTADNNIHIIINYSWKTHNKKNGCVFCFMLTYTHFSFDSLGLDKVDFENYFACELIDMAYFSNHKALVCLIKYSYACFK